MLVNHLTAGAHRIRLPKTRFSGEKTPLGHIRTSLFSCVRQARRDKTAHTSCGAPCPHHARTMDSPCADHVFTMFLAKGAAKAKGTSWWAKGQSAKGRVGEGDVLMRPSWILMPFIPPRVQRIGSETLIAGRLRVHLPVTHPRAQRIERERAKGTS